MDEAGVRDRLLLVRLDDGPLEFVKIEPGERSVKGEETKGCTGSAEAVISYSRLIRESGNMG